MLTVCQDSHSANVNRYSLGNKRSVFSSLMSTLFARAPVFAPSPPTPPPLLLRTTTTTTSAGSRATTAHPPLRIHREGRHRPGCRIRGKVPSVHSKQYRIEISAESTRRSEWAKGRVPETQSPAERSATSILVNKKKKNPPRNGFPRGDAYYVRIKIPSSSYSAPLLTQLISPLSLILPDPI